MWRGTTLTRSAQDLRDARACYGVTCIRKGAGAGARSAIPTVKTAGSKSDDRNGPGADQREWYCVLGFDDDARTTRNSDLRLGLLCTGGGLLGFGANAICVILQNTNQPTGAVT